MRRIILIRLAGTLLGIVSWVFLFLWWALIDCPDNVIAHMAMDCLLLWGLFLTAGLWFLLVPRK